MKKNEYFAPKMEVIEMKVKSPVMVISGGGPGKTDDPYEGDE